MYVSLESEQPELCKQKVSQGMIGTSPLITYQYTLKLHQLQVTAVGGYISNSGGFRTD